MKTKTKITYGRMSLAAFSLLLFTTGCSDDKTPVVNSGEDELVELQVNPGVVALTRSAIQGGTSAESGVTTDATKLNSIAVYAQSTNNNTTAKGNNYALYTRTNNATTWAASGSEKIYLSAEKATVYAYHPAYQPDGTTKAFKPAGTALKVAGDVTATSTIPISVYQGSSGTASDYTITAIANDDNTSATKNVIASAPGEVDYMWSDGTVEADNGKGTIKKSAVTLTMKHALSMVSFRVYNDGTYHLTGNLTKVVLNNKSGSSILSSGTNPTMKVSDGTVTTGAAVAATFTRTISGYTLANSAAAAKKLSILVLPESTANKSTVQAVFTIDGTDYDVTLPTTGAAWVSGENYLYTVKLSGKELSITSVTVTQWTDKTGGNLDIQ